MHLSQLPGQFCEWLVKASWQAAVLVLFVLLIQRLLGNRLTPVWRYNLWLIVLIRLALPVSPESSWSIFNYPGLNNEVVPIGQKFFGTAPEKELNAEKFSHAREGIVEIVSIPFNSMIDMAYPAVASLVEEGQNSKSGFIRWIFFKVNRMELFAGVWLTGFLFFGLRAVRNYRLLFRHLNALEPVKDYRALKVWEQAREAIRCNVKVTLVESDLVHSPALCGFRKYRLLIPPGMISHFSESELKMVFLHELAHLKRGDVQINWLATFFQLLHWFNPVLWWGLKCMRTDREIAADAMVLMNADGRERKAYGRTVIRLLEGFSPTPSTGFVGLLEDDEQFKHRIRMMATFKGPVPSWSLLGCSMVMLLGFVGLTDRPSLPLIGESVANVQTQSVSIVEMGEKHDMASRAFDPLPATDDSGRSHDTENLTGHGIENSFNRAGPFENPALPDSASRVLQAADVVNLLRPYGTWVEHPDFGISWAPNASLRDRSWRPFRDNGRWSASEKAYSWNSDFVWGWVAFQHGSWGQDASTGLWYWVPDSECSSARVHWRATPHFVGWTPIAPDTGNGPETHDRWNADQFVFVARNEILSADLEFRELSAFWKERLLAQSESVDYSSSEAEVDESKARYLGGGFTGKVELATSIREDLRNLADAKREPASVTGARSSRYREIGYFQNP